MPTQLRPAAFLDRDGVINRDVGYVGRIADFEVLPGVFEAMRRLESAGYLLVVITNQSGIARGYFDLQAFQDLTAHMTAEFLAHGVNISATYFCPHLSGGVIPEYSLDCECRKPRPGMILQAAADLRLDLAASILFGDKDSDLQAGWSAGVGRGFKITPEAPQQSDVVDGGYLSDLESAVDVALGGPAFS